jgi:hypothetical protein
MKMIVLQDKATEEQIADVSEHFEGYIKVVVDIKKKIACAGADRHFDEEQELIRLGSIQSNLWGGGIDIQTGEVDYNSMINIRPNQNNPSRDIMSLEIRKIFDEIVADIFK